MNSSSVHKNITVFGRVQGVFYRASTCEKAIELGVKGNVKNQHDGSVYIEAEGSLEGVNSLIEWCREGSQFAHVETLDFEEGDWKGYDKFEIRRW